MVCENYTGLLMKAASGELAPSRHSELIVHVSGCEGCREAYGRAQMAMALADQGIDALVTGDPSPQFAAKLRARIADEKMSSRAAWAWLVPVAASAIILAGIATIATMSSLKHHLPRAPVPNIASVPSRGVSGASSVSHPPAVIGGTRSHALHARAVFSAREHEVLVAPGQMEALLRLNVALQQQPANRARAVAQPEEIAQPLEVKPLEIKSLEVSKIDDFIDLSGGF